MRRSSRPLIALLALAVLVPAVPAGTAPSPCPLYRTDGAVLISPPADPDLEAGSYGFAHQRIQGVGIEVTGDVVTATMTVEDMQRRVMPGYQKALWVVGGMLGIEEWEHRFEGPYRAFNASYDLATDRFEFVLTGTDIPNTPVAGQVILGPGGGVRISATLEQLALPDGVDVLGDTWGETAAYAVYGLSIRSSRWMKEGPFAAPLIPCPGASLEAGFTGAWYTAQVRGWVLPLGIESAVIEELVEGEWVPRQTVAVDELGRYDHVFEISRTTHVLRLRADGGSLGEILSPPVTLEP